jgi:hypothetical protein
MKNQEGIKGDRSFIQSIENATSSYIHIDQSITKIKKNSFVIVGSIIIGVLFTLFAYNSATQRDILNSQTRANIVQSTLNDGAYFSFWIVGSWLVLYQFTIMIGNIILAHVKDEYLAASIELLDTIQTVESLDELEFLHQQLMGIPHLDHDSVNELKQAIYEQSVKLTS